MRFLSGSINIFWVAVSIVLVYGHLGAAQFAAPPPPLWHFATRSSDNSVVMVRHMLDGQTNIL
jgi:hypothetical protein